MAITFGINGFGRIGKLCLHLAINKNYNVKHINAPGKTLDDIIYALKYDTIFQKLATAKKHPEKNGVIVVFSNNKEYEIKITTERKPEDIKWEINFLIESSGVFKTRSEIEKHNVEYVILTCPSKELNMYVYGVNHENLKKGEKIISNASCTTNCLAPIVKVLHDNFIIEEGLMSTIHSVTGTQSVVDKTNDKRISRSVLNNIIPSTTGAALAVTKVIPSLKGKLTGMSYRVPVIDVSVVDLTVKFKKETSLEKIKKIIKETADPKILGITEDNVVSSDFIRDSRSSIFDFGASIELNNTFFKIVCWYDNEYGYSCRVMDLISEVIKVNELDL